MQARTYNCPNCQANLVIPEGRNSVFCTYCGSHVQLDNGEQILRIVDEARIAETETDRTVRLREIEADENERKSFARSKTIKMAIYFIIGFVSIYLMYINGFDEKNPAEITPLQFAGTFGLVFSVTALIINAKRDSAANHRRDGKIKVPDIVASWDVQKKEIVKASFESAGFTNIRLVPLKDLGIFSGGKKEIVESITVNGEKVKSKNKWFDPNALVVISYHSNKDF